MRLGSSDANRMLLIAGDLLVAQETDMALFTITEHHLVNTMYGDLVAPALPAEA